MASLSKVMVIGVLTRRFEVKALPSGGPQVRGTLSVMRVFKDRQGNTREEASFFNLLAFGKRAEVLAKYGHKGSRLFVDGRLQARAVVNEEGCSRTEHVILVEGFQFLDLPLVECPEEKEESGD